MWAGTREPRASTRNRQCTHVRAGVPLVLDDLDDLRVAAEALGLALEQGRLLRLGVIVDGGANILPSGGLRRTSLLHCLCECVLGGRWSGFSARDPIRTDVWMGPTTP